MTSVLGTVTNWLGGSRERTPSPKGERDEKKSEDTVADNANTSGKEESTGPDVAATENESTSKSALPIDVDLHEVSEKAMHAAKEWGSYLFSVGKAATEQVAKTAKQFKDTVEDKTIIGEFSREQDKFVAEHREKKKQSEAAVPPWVGYNEEEIMKSQILALSKDRRNFLRNPPAGVQFHFEYEASYPIAMVMLDEDPNLKEMRFNIVPREVKEEIFWRNYFYRVSLIKQSTQLTSMTQHAAKPAAIPVSKSEASSRTADTGDVENEELPVGSPLADHEFVSDSFQSDGINADELKKEMHQLGMTDKSRETEPGKKKKVPTATLR